MLTTCTSESEHMARGRGSAAAERPRLSATTPPWTMVCPTGLRDVTAAPFSADTALCSCRGLSLAHGQMCPWTERGLGPANKCAEGSNDTLDFESSRADDRCRITSNNNPLIAASTPMACPLPLVCAVTRFSTRRSLQHTKVAAQFSAGSTGFPHQLPVPRWHLLIMTSRIDRTLINCRAHVACRPPRSGTRVGWTSVRRVQGLSASLISTLPQQGCNPKPWMGIKGPVAHY